MARDYLNPLNSGYISAYDSILPQGLKPGKLIVTSTNCIAVSAKNEKEVTARSHPPGNFTPEPLVFGPGVFGMYLETLKTPSRKYVKFLIDETPYILLNGNFSLVL